MAILTIEQRHDLGKALLEEKICCLYPVANPGGGPGPWAPHPPGNA